MNLSFLTSDSSESSGTLRFNCGTNICPPKILKRFNQWQQYFNLKCRALLLLTNLSHRPVKWNIFCCYSCYRPDMFLIGSLSGVPQIHKFNFCYDFYSTWVVSDNLRDSNVWVRLKSTIYIYIYIYIRGVTGWTDQTSGGCSLCYTIPI